MLLTDQSVNAIVDRFAASPHIVSRAMSVQRELGPQVGEDAVEFAVPDFRLSGVALLHELRRPRRVEFARDGKAGWRLTLPRPEADRLEYMLELTYRNGRSELSLD